MKLTKQRILELIREEIDAERSRDPDRARGVKPAPVKRTIRKKDIGSDLGLGDVTISPRHARSAQLRRRANRAAGYSSSGHRTQAGQERLEAPGTEPADQPLLDIGVDPDKIAAVRQAALEKRLAAEEAAAPAEETRYIPNPHFDPEGTYNTAEPTAAEAAAAEADRQAWAAEKAAEKDRAIARDPEQQQESLELNEEITRWHKLAGL